MVNFIIFENLSFDFCSPGLDGWMRYMVAPGGELRSLLNAAAVAASLHRPQRHLSSSSSP